MKRNLHWTALAITLLAPAACDPGTAAPPTGADDLPTTSDDDDSTAMGATGIPDDDPDDTVPPSGGSTSSSGSVGTGSPTTGEGGTTDMSAGSVAGTEQGTTWGTTTGSHEGGSDPSFGTSGEETFGETTSGTTTLGFDTEFGGFCAFLEDEFTCTFFEGVCAWDPGTGTCEEL